MTVSYPQTETSKSSDNYIDTTKSSTSGGENVQSFSRKVISRLEQILTWFNGLATVATSGSYNDLINKPTTTAGTSTQPIYFSSGTPTACGTSLAVDITGNAATATNATTAASCSGNAATSSSCTGNAATATYATSAGSATSATSATTAAACTGNAATATKSSKTNQLEAFTGDDFSSGGHFIKAIRSSTGWATRLWTCYEDGAKQADAVQVYYANNAGQANYDSNSWSLYGLSAGGNNNRGYIKFSNGFIICFGYIAGGNGASQVFLAAFQSAPSVTLTHGGSRQTDAGFGNCYSVSNTTITVYTTYRDSDYGVKYIACGF